MTENEEEQSGVLDRPERTYAPAYVPAKSLWSFISSLDPKAIPRKIDRSMMRTLSGGVQRKLMSALTFLGLIRRGGETTQQLRELVNAKGNPDQYKAALKATLETAYAGIIGDMDVGTASAKQLADAFRKANLDGTTLNEAIRFYVKARKEAGLPVSPYIDSRERNSPAAKPVEKNGNKPRAKRGSFPPPGNNQRHERGPDAQSEETSVPPRMVAIPLYPYPRRILIPVDLIEAECDTADTMMRAYAKSVSSAKGEEKERG